MQLKQLVLQFFRETLLNVEHDNGTLIHWQRKGLLRKDYIYATPDQLQFNRHEGDL